MSTKSSLDTLIEVQSHLNKAIDDLKRITTAKSFPIPDLNEPFHPSTEEFHKNTEAAEAAAIASAAALQIASTLMQPHVALYEVVGGPYKAAALRVCLESAVTEILREAGPKGLHVQEIAAQNGLDPVKLTRCLRILATHHIYREVAPDVFANNRVSSLLDTGKPSKDMLSNSVHKYDNVEGMAALVGHHLDETFKVSAWVWESVSDPSTGKSTSLRATVFSRAFNTQDRVWEFFARPEQKLREQRFHGAMKAATAMQPPDTVINSFDWKSLKPGSVIVDVGGGIGAATMNVLRKFPELKLVVQDLPNVIGMTKEYWKDEMPEAISSGRVTFETLDFFTGQTQKNASVFFVKQILHDWPDEECRTILSNLRKAATPETKLVMVDSLISYACCDSIEENRGIPGIIPKEAPAPLLANFGAVNNMTYHSDMIMFMMMNGQDRTARHMNQLLESAGWKIIAVRRSSAESTFLVPVEAVPI